MTHRQIKALSRRIAKNLFKVGSGERGYRLALQYHEDSHLPIGVYPGWCESAVADQIFKALEKYEMKRI